MTPDSHSTRAELELLFLGEACSRVTEHVQECRFCHAELRALEERQQRLRRRHPPLAYVRSLREADRRAQRRVGLLQALGAGLAAAAAVLLVSQWRAMEIDGLERPWLEGAPGGGVSDRTSTHVQNVQESVNVLRPKGESHLAIVRRRGGDVCLLRGRVGVQPGDAVGVRFTLDAPGLVAAGIMLDEGGWLPLFEGGFGAGKHTPEATLEVTATPGAGLLLLGLPDQVRAARAGEPAVVESARLVWSPAVVADRAQSSAAGASPRGRSGDDECPP